MPIVPATPENLEHAAELLRSGGVVAFPTETVYGLGANALDPPAVARIFEIKRRPTFDPLIVHVLDDAMLDRVALGVPPLARALMARFWPGPLTLVLRKTPAIGDLVTAGLETVAVRMPSHPIARALLQNAQIPLAAPSANPFGYLSPTRAEHVDRTLGDAVDLIVDAGPASRGIESTIVMLEPTPTLLRHGAIAVEEIEAIAGSLVRDVDATTAPLAPGRLAHHYAPRTPVRLIAPEDVPLAERRQAAALTFRRPVDGYSAVRVLSPAGNLRDAAAHLFEYLHELDCSGVERIDAQPLPLRGLGAAIMDRLRRAAAR